MRISRIWGDLKTRKRFGFGHDGQGESASGDLALFCPACPQPGINLPADWEKKPDQCVLFPCLYVHISVSIVDRWLYRRSIVVDGNFSAEHMKMKGPKNDVWLSDGEGYMVKEGPYIQHLKETAEIKQVSFRILRFYI
jgi:hypothetical protein